MLEEFAGAVGLTRSRRHFYLLIGQDIVPFSPLASVAHRRFPDAWLRLPFRAQRIRIKNNLRVFGIDGVSARTAKISIDAHRTLFREVRCRRLLTAHPGLSVAIPALHGYDNVHGRWLVETQVKPQEEASQLLATAFVRHHAEGFYAPTVRLRAAIDVAEGGVLPVALCHGDLSAGNMLRGTDGKLYLVDWEHARVMPIALDLSTLFARYEDLRADILRILRELSPRARGVLDARAQMSWALRARNRTLEVRRGKQTEYLMRVLGLSREAAAERLACTTARNEVLIRQLEQGH